MWSLMLTIGVALAGQGRTVPGPWALGGSHVTVAEEGFTVHAAWLDDGRLLYARSEDAGMDWTRAEVVAPRAEAGDGGQIRPELVVTAKGPMIAFSAGDRAHVARRTDAGWKAGPLTSTEDPSSLLDVSVIDGQPFFVWLVRHNGEQGVVTDVYARWNGLQEAVWVDGADGVCPCCRPAAGVVGGRPAVAFRDAEGAKREVRVLVRDTAGWVDKGHVTRGGWSPGGCPNDGPVWMGGEVLVSDGRTGDRRLYRSDGELKAVEGAQALQPRVVDDHVIWVSAAPGSVALRVDDAVVATSTGRMEVGDPVRVGSEVWIPWQGDRARVTAVRVFQ